MMGVQARLSHHPSLMWSEPTSYNTGSYEVYHYWRSFPRGCFCDVVQFILIFHKGHNVVCD